MSQYYTVGRGMLFLAPHKPGTVEPDGFRFLGNAPQVSITREANELEHRSSMCGLSTLDASVVIEDTMSIQFTLDEMDPLNVALFLYGAAQDIAVTSATGITESFTNVQPGRSYMLGYDPATNPSGVMQIDSSTFQASIGGTALVLGQDYTLDASRGRIFLLPNAPNVTPGSQLDVTYDQLTYTRTHIASGVQQFEGALQFLSYNPQGRDLSLYFPHVRISATGDWSLVSEEWMQLQFDGKVLTPQGMSAVYADTHDALSKDCARVR